ncbi:MAG: hypothetical protein JW807_11085 [Spirochaetes bacterium]|nr:hypothetical protein [Spirochaetota bacterium]
MNNTDWPLIRQSLSLALLTGGAAAINGGGSFLESRPEYRPVFDDIAAAAEKLGAGRLNIEGEAILYEPRPFRPGTYAIETGPRSSAVEVLLFLMPALSRCDFRSVLEIGGVTHSVLSCPTAFVKETLMGGIERLGFFGSLTLKRFGFHGSGGGRLESRVYPREPGKAAAGPAAKGRTIAGAKIFFSRLDAGLAEMEKRLLAEEAGIDPGRISIIEVLESDGAGNSVQVFADRDGLLVVLFREMLLYGKTGDIVLSEEILRYSIDELAREARALITDGSLPDIVMRELYPYYIMAGVDPEFSEETPAIKSTVQACRRFL